MNVSKNLMQDIQAFLRLESHTMATLHAWRAATDLLMRIETNDHNFGEQRASRQGMNHTADGYRVCTKCHRSDTYLLLAGNGELPPCQA